MKSIVAVKLEYETYNLQLNSLAIQVDGADFL